MIKKQGKEYYPLNFGKLVKNEKVYYDRAERKKNYFYLALNTQQNNSSQPQN